MTPLVNFSHRKVGGIRFIRMGHFCFSFCASRKMPEYGAQSQNTVLHGVLALVLCVFVARMVQIVGGI